MSLRTLFSAFEEQLALFNATATPSASSTTRAQVATARTSITRPTEQVLGGDTGTGSLKLLPGEAHHGNLLLPSQGSMQSTRRKNFATSHLETRPVREAGTPSAGTGFLFRLQHHAGAVEPPAPATRGIRSSILAASDVEAAANSKFRALKTKTTTKKAAGRGPTSFYLDCSAESGAMEVMPRSVKNMCQKLLDKFYKKRWTYGYWMPLKLIYDDWTDLMKFQFKWLTKKNYNPIMPEEFHWFYNTKSQQWSRCTEWHMNQCGKFTAKSSWIPEKFRKRFCTDDWYECQTLEEPWTYFGFPSMQQWNSSCGVGPSLLTPLLSGTPLTQLGSCSRASEVCLVPTFSGTGAYQHYFRAAAKAVGLTQEQLQSWTNLQDYRCKDLGTNLNKEILQMLERSPDTRLNTSKLNWLWGDKTVFF
ncbi:unnamed protein product [Amoebophrya sp. A120]|nr:unnamed protein product [Amoebophrya sp. A120]|eukprot:GSA120T00025598001.1